MRSPFKGKFKVTAVYGAKGARWSSYHRGIDLVGVTTYNVTAPCDGVVTFSGWQNPSNFREGFGKYVSMWDENKTNKLYFAHLAEAYVRVGQVVKKGDRLGLMGNTGNSSGTHTHFEIRKDGKKGADINPATWMGIPNKAGTYTEVDDMTEAEVRKIVNDILKERDAETVLKPVSDWARDAWNAAKAQGVFDGSKPQAAITRQETALVLKRLGLIK